ncbi:hypothetical protein NECAME_14358 [Necator americanus]|uniref:Uncharacterized protein n=1 Tax=Necator americanus TaxID=51031 RepID=W2SNH9_NECAM|nr:hypothetical protein NECAME_14358 [Necator americanus]ETN71093.1 hypothetical protein NECAME_14358 [Necator americanus]
MKCERLWICPQPTKYLKVLLRPERLQV